MLRALIKTRLQMAWHAAASIGGRRKNRKLFTALILVLILFSALSIAGMFGMYFSSMALPFHQGGLGWFYFALAGVTAFSVCFVSSIFMAQPMLFQAKDNDLLLAMPIPPGMILASRMAALMVFNLAFTLMVMLPAGLAWAVQVGTGALNWLYFALICLALPAMALALSSLAGWGLAAVSGRLRRKTLLVTVLSIALMLGYFFLMFQMNSFLARLVQDGQQIAEGFRRVLPPAYHLGLSVAQGKGSSLALFLASALLPFGAVWLVIQHFFIRIVTANRGNVKARYIEQPLKTASPCWALTKKELRLFFQSTTYLLNSGFGLIFMLALPVLLLIQPDILAPLLSQLAIPSDLLALGAAAALCLMASSVLISASSISLEGKTLWIVQSLPLSPGQVLIAKAHAHMLLALPAALVSGLATGLILRLPAPSLLFVMLLPALIAALTGLAGVLINLKLPKFDWNTQTEAVKQGASVIITMAAGFAAVALPAALYVLVLMDSLSPVLFMAAYAFVLMGLCALLYHRLKHRSTRDFLALSP